MSYAWYIVQALSGHEKKVAESIREKAEREGLLEYFEKITVPTEEVIEVKKGRKVNTERKFFPGYVMVRMRMDDKAWHLVRSVPKVTGFLGGSGRPQPISDVEAGRIFKQIEDGLERPKHGVTFESGETVKVIDGPFDSFDGVIEEVDEEKGKIKVSVTIFGRATPVELEYSQVEKKS